MFSGGPKHAGAPSKPLIWPPFRPIFFTVLGLDPGKRIFVRSHVHIADSFLKIFCEFERPEFTSTIFPILSMTPWRPL